MIVQPDVLRTTFVMVALSSAACGSNGTGPGVQPAAIAFLSNRDTSGDFDIYVMDSRGGQVTNLTRHTGGDFSPAWSPDGNRIAFASYRDGAPEIYVMNADGSGQTRLTNNFAVDFAPAWSPDGSHIAFTSDRDGLYEVYVMNADGSGQTNLTKNGANDDSPSWSPDGLKIAFASDRDGNDREIYDECRRDRSDEADEQHRER